MNAFTDTSSLLAWMSLVMGISVGLIFWLISHVVAAIPVENREFKDHPPWGFRIVWWPVQWLAYLIEQVWPAHRQSSTQSKLRMAGLDFQINPAQFMASRVVGAGLGVMSALFAMTLLLPDQKRDTETLVLFALAGSAFGSLYPGLWLKDRLSRRRNELLKTLPFYLDIITLCVEAGLNLQGALAHALNKGPKGVIHEELRRVMRDIRAGQSRGESLRRMADRLKEPGITQLVSALTQAESMGMNLGPILRAQAEQRRNERFVLAEKRALQAPVKMLFPLIAFIFPCTFIVLFFPIAMKLMHLGL